jgi:hypothetical protein
MPNKGETIRSGHVYKRAKLWHKIPDEDWKIMSPSMRRSYVNGYRLEFASYKRELMKLGYSRYAIGYIVAMRQVGYVFDAIHSYRGFLNFLYEGGSTYFRSWKDVKAWLNEYGR